jgi:predicted alpha/beta-hydrolase family hydrolase
MADDNSRSQQRRRSPAVDIAVKAAPNDRVTERKRAGTATERRRAGAAIERKRAVTTGVRAIRLALEGAGAIDAGAHAEVAGESIDLDGHPGLVVRPAGARAMYMLAHGAGAGMRHALLASVAGRLAARRIATLRWEFPYMAAGKPRPDRAEVAESAVREVWAAARARFGELALFAGGQSFGGRMTSRAHAAAPLPGLCGLIFLAFPLYPPDKPSLERAEHLAAAAGPMLFLQGDRDDFADLRRLRPVVRKLGPRATLHVVAAADHGFHVQVRSGRTRDDVLDEIGDTIASWVTSHAARG